MPSFCTSASFREPVENSDGSFTIQIAGDSKLHEYNGMPLKELSTDEYMSRAAPPVMYGHGWTYPFPIGKTSQICYDASSDVWSATFFFAKDDDIAGKARNLFKQGLLYASISWHVDELTTNWRTAEKKLLEWSLTATPRDMTVIESFQHNSNMPEPNKNKICSKSSYTQEQLDEALEKQKQEFEQKLQAQADEHKAALKTQSEEYQQKLDTQKEEFEQKETKLEQSVTDAAAKYVAMENKQKAETLAESYSALLPEEFEAKTPRDVLETACGNMLEKGKEYSITELKDIADGLLLDRKKANEPTSKAFSHMPDNRYQGDLMADLLTTN